MLACLNFDEVWYHKGETNISEESSKLFKQRNKERKKLYRCPQMTKHWSMGLEITTVKNRKFKEERSLE